MIVAQSMSDIMKTCRDGKYDEHDILPALAVELLGQCVNYGWLRSERGVDVLLDAFLRQHRTLQQGILGGIVGMLKKWTRNPKSSMVDGRNEDAWNWANEAVTLKSGAHPFRYI